MTMNELVLHDEDVGNDSVDVDAWSTRKAVRCVLFRDSEVVLLHVQEHHYHKLPGGGMDSRETEDETLRREVREEVGSEIEISDALGKITEVKSQQAEKQHSICYLAKEKSQGINSLTKLEQENNFCVESYSIEDAINLLKNESPDDYMGKFIVARDLHFLQLAKQKLEEIQNESNLG